MSADTFGDMDTSFRRLKREIALAAAAEFKRTAAGKEKLFSNSVNVCSMMAHIEKRLWEEAAQRLLAKDTAVTQELMRIAGEC